MVGRTARFRRPSWATAPAVPPKEEEYVTTDGETPPPSDAASTQGRSTPSSSQNSTNGTTSNPRRSTRITSKTPKRNPVVPTRSSPKLLAPKVGGVAARQRNQMESLSESSDSTTTPGTPVRGWQTPEAAKIPLPPSAAPTPMVSGRYRTPRRGSAGRKLDDMGVSSGITEAAGSSHRPSTERRREERKAKAPSSMIDEESFGEELPSWGYLFPRARDTTQTRLPRGRSGRRERRMADPNSNETLAEFFGPLLFLLQFAWYLIKNFFGFLRAPLIWIFFIYVAAVLTAYAGRQTTKVLVSSITALCWLPGVTEFELLPFCKAPTPRSSDEDDTGAWARKPELPSAWNLLTGPQYPTPNFRQLVDLQGSYSDVLESSELGAVVGVHLRAAHSSITDLSTVVRLSKLKSRGQLVAHLDEFAEGARAAADELSRFQGRVGVEIDILLSVNEWTVRNLEEAKKREAEIEASRLTSGLTGLVLAPFRIAEMQAIQRQVRDIFLGASQRLEKGLEELILRADIIVGHLENLDNRLINIHEVAVEADEKLAEDQEKILESLWSRFFLRKDLSRYEDHRKKLEAVTIYRGIARNKVTDTTLDLRSMLDHLRELRRSVSQPIIQEKNESADGDNGAKREREKMNVGSIPLEVHIDAVTKGAKRLLDDRNRARQRLKEDLERAQSQELSRIRGEKPEAIPDRLPQPKRSREAYTETETSQPSPPPPPRKDNSEKWMEGVKRVEDTMESETQENQEKKKKRKGFAIYSFTQLPGTSAAGKTPDADGYEFEGLKRRRRR